MSSRKAAKKIQKDTLLPKVKSKKPRLHGAETALPGSGLARKKRGAIKSTKKKRADKASENAERIDAPTETNAPGKRKRASKLVTGIAVVTAVVGTAIGSPSEATAANRSSLRDANFDPIGEVALPEADAHLWLPSKFWAFESGRNIPILLKEKQNQEKHKGKVLNGVMLTSKNSYRVSLENNWHADILLRPTSDRITFRIMVPSPKAGERPKELDSFSMDYSNYKFANPTLYVRADANNIFIGLLNKATSQFVRIRMEKTNLDPNAVLIRAFNGSYVESTPQQAFALLSNLPVPAWTESESSRALKAVFASGERTLGKLISDYDAGEHKGDLSTLIDDFIDINAKVIDVFIAELKAQIKDLPPKDRRKILQEVEPYLLALVLRPFAIWADDPNTITRLDKLIVSSKLNEDSLWYFAKQNNLLRECGELAINLREELSGK